MKRVVIIGGGASGLISSIYASKKDYEVIIIEKNDICGKKILATGNGRCNYWNEDQNLKHYRTSSTSSFESVFSNENLNKLQHFFYSIGIVPKIKNGYYYPFSNQAISMQKALITEALKCNVKIRNNTEMKSIKKLNNGFKIITKNGEEIFANKIILSTGSKATPKTGSDGIGYEICKKLNHKIIKVLPSLVQLKSRGNFLTCWDGIRADCKVTRYENNICMDSQIGEIQLTNYGVSGICIFNLSGEISRGLDRNKNEEIHINFLNSLNITNEIEFINWMNKRNDDIKDRNILQLLEGVLNCKLATVLIKESNLNINNTWNNIDNDEKIKLARNIIAFKLSIIDTNSFDKAQVCSGGVSLDDIDLRTMQSKIVKDFYVVGELLDVDGDCGGYNLEWAWLTGMIAGSSV